MENIVQPPPHQQESPNYASFGKRFAANMIDRVLITFFCSPIYWEISREMDRYKRLLPRRRRSFDAFFGGSSDFYGGRSELVDSYTTMAFGITVIIIAWCYFAGMESSPWRATLGKRLLGLEVNDESGKRVNFIQATGRHFGKILSGILFYIGYLVMLGSPKKQTWHDQMSNCIVTEK